MVSKKKKREKREEKKCDVCAWSENILCNLPFYHFINEQNLSLMCTVRPLCGPVNVNLVSVFI